ncbi:MAG: hypothetical protein HW377_765 [Actinobacteria bacterium]|jgi:hypothetical protein|nr:hypothetical protein [Actinomycetota bacterium]MBM2827519.1 hypothetical protein [Actinomycetota bacterium]
MTNTDWTHAALIGIASLAINLPLGYLRAGARKFSLKWFVYIHLPVPLFAYLRRSENLSAWIIPSFIAGALLGQFFGGRMRRFRQNST